MKKEGEKMGKTLPKIEEREAMLALKCKGLKQLGAIILILYPVSLLEQYALPEGAAWYRSLFHLILPGVAVLWLLTMLGAMVERVDILRARHMPTVGLMRTWGLRMAVPGCACMAVVIGCFIWVQAAPGILFGPAGCLLGAGAVMMLFHCSSMRANREPDWARVAFICGIAGTALMGAVCGAAYLLGNDYDGHLALATWGLPALIYTVVCGMKCRKAGKTDD